MDCLCAKHCQSTEWSLHCSMLSSRLKGRWTPQSTLSGHRVVSSLFNVVIQKKSQLEAPQSTLSEHRVMSSLFNVVIQTHRQMNPLQTTVRAQGDLFTVQCCHWDSQADGPLMCKTLLEHRVISSLFSVVIETQRQMEAPLQHCQSTGWSLNCSMLSFRLKGRWTRLCAKHCQSTEWSLHCSILSFRLKGRWTPPSTLSEHRVISSLFNVVIQIQRKRDPPQSTLSEHRVISSLFNVVIQTQRQMRLPSDAKHCQSTEWSLHCSMLSLRFKGRWSPPFNTIREQSYLFTVQCCHSDSKADGAPQSTLLRAQSDLLTVQCCHWDSKEDGPPSQHCESTGWSLHCSMLSFRLKGRWTPPWSTLSENRVISSLFNVVIQTQKQMNPLCAKHCQSTEWSLHCLMLSLRLKDRGTPPSQHCQSTEWSLHCSMCHWYSKADGPPQSTLSQHRVISSLFNVVIETQRQTDIPQSTLSDHRVITTLFSVVIETQRQMDPQSILSEHRVISSLFNVVIQTQRQVDPPWSTLSEHTMISPLFNVVIQTHKQMDPSVQTTVRAQSDHFTLQCCHSDSKAGGPPWSTLSEHRVISSLFNVVIQTQRQMDPPSTLSEHRVISSLFNVVIQIQRQMDPPSTLSEHRLISSLFNVVIQTQKQMPPPKHCQSTEWSLHSSVLSLRLKGRWTPTWSNTVRAQSYHFTVQCCHSDSKAYGPPMCKTLPEHRVISSLFNVVIQIQRQMDPPFNTIREQSCLFTVQCCHSDSKADGAPSVNTVRAQSDLLTVQCCHSDSKADWPPLCKTLPEHRVISSLFNVVIQTQRQMDTASQHCQSTEWSLHCSMLSFRLKGRWTPPSTLSEHRVISSLFNVVIQTQRQMDPPSQHCQSTEWSLHCSVLSLRLKGRWIPTWSTLSEHRVISSLFNVVIQTQRQMDPLCAKHCQSTEWSLHCSMLSFRFKGRWTPPVQNTIRDTELISSLFNVVIQTQRQMDHPPVNTVRAQSYLFTVQCCHPDS